MTGLMTRRSGLDRDEVATTAVAVIVSSGLFVAYGRPYLARGVVGDLLGFALLAAPLVLRRRRVRHEALVCLAGIGVVHLLGADWPLAVGSTLWWVAFAGGLGGYLALRRAALRPLVPHSRR